MTPSFAPTSILMVDDNPDDFYSVRRCLQKAGLSNPLLGCEDGTQAMAWLSAEGQGKPMLVLMDINMPGVKGTEVLAWMRGRADTARLPVIMLTSSDDDRDVLAAFNGEANGYLHKPLDFDKLIAALQRVRSHRLELVLSPREPG